MLNKKVRAETRLTMRQAARLMETNPETIRNWTRFGLLSPDTGERFTLEYTRWLNLRVTSAEALDRFTRKLHGEL